MVGKASSNLRPMVPNHVLYASRLLPDFPSILLKDMARREESGLTTQSVVKRSIN